MPTIDKRVDAYIARSQDFAKPILEHFRALVHQGAPDAEETLKWGMPYFMLNGIHLCGMASFKNHCAFIFRNAALMKDSKVLSKKGREAMGHLGRIGSLKDLPPKKELLAYIREAAELNRKGVKAPLSSAGKKPPVKVPPDLTRGLKTHPKAKAVFTGFTQAQKRDYVEWLEEAKTEATRQRRLATALEWIAEGKQRNWKYMR